MFMPVMMTCLASSCFLWGGTVSETKDECNQKLGAVMAHAQKDKDVKAYHGECIKVRFSYDEGKEKVKHEVILR